MYDDPSSESQNVVDFEYWSLKFSKVCQNPEFYYKFDIFEFEDFSILKTYNFPVCKYSLIR